MSNFNKLDKNIHNKRLTSWLLGGAILTGSLIAGVNLGGINANATVVPEGATVLIACSDYQLQDTDTLSTRTRGHFQLIKENGYEDVDGFIFAGDYTYVNSTSESTTRSGLKSLKADFEETFGYDSDEVLIQGNHDTAIGTVGMTLSGNNDSKDYGVFVINEDDYMYKSGDEDRVKETAANLKTYLDEKKSLGYTKPIFVVSHVPLHYSMRSKHDKDTIYAYHIFDVINAAGADGLNIIFLFGHDHSKGWDDYIGGGAVYLPKGSNINIAQGSKTSYKAEKLNFTYLNAGYVGYYNCTNTGADKTLTMTTYVITDDKVAIERYDASGLHNLKAKGVFNNQYDEETEMDYTPDLNVYASAQVVTLDKWAYNAEFFCDKHATVTAAGNDNAQYAPAVNASTGALDTSGNGVIDFTVKTKKGWEVKNIEIKQSTKYEELKCIDASQGKYRITGVKDVLDVTVTTKECSHSYVSGACTKCGKTEFTGAINFKDSKSTDFIEVDNQQDTSIISGKGLYFKSSNNSFETVKDQLEGIAAKRPVDAVKIDAEGNWNATIKLKVQNYSSSAKYEYFGFYAMDDYNNLVGIRMGSSDCHDFKKIKGKVTADTMSAGSGHTKAAEHWLRITKYGDDYTCLYSSDGTNFTQLYTFADTGVKGNTILLDAYSGSTTVREYYVESLSFAQHEERVGDVNRDGYIDANDVTIIARHLAKIDIITDEKTLALCNTDGIGTEPSAADVTHLARYLAHIISEL